MTSYYYGWKIVAALFVILLFSSGFGFYNHAVMLQALIVDKALPITVASTAVSIFFLSSGLIGLAVSSAIEKYDVRYVITAGAAIAAVSLCGIAYVETPWQLFICYSLFGVGWCASGLLPATTLVTRWFEHKRAVALSVTSTGLSVGGVLITPISALLIEHRGIEFSVAIFAAIYFLGTVPVCWWLLKDDPGDIGLTADGHKLDPSDIQAVKGQTLASAMTGRYFWGLSVAYIFLMLAQVGGIAHHYGIVGTYLSTDQAAIALGVIPVASIIGRLAGGYLLGYFSSKLFSIAMMILQSMSLASLASASTVPVFIISLALFGITIGNLLMLQPLLIAETFGRREYSRIYSVSNFMSTLGVAAGPILMGVVYTQFDSYEGAYHVASLAGLLGLLIFLFAIFPNKRGHKA